MELIQYWRLIVQNRIVIGASTLVGLVIAAAITFTTTPLYESQAQIFVSTPSSSLDIQPKIDEYRIVGPTAGSVGITSIRSGDGTTSSTIVSVTLDSELVGLDVDTAFQVNGINASGYDGQFVVSEITDSTNFKYQVSNAPVNPLPTTTGSTVTLQVDTVTSASPYIFNISLRSVFGMCGVLSDGDKATGFKSMVIAQFTGIGLQKDKNAFVKYDPSLNLPRERYFFIVSFFLKILLLSNALIHFS